MLSRKMMLLIAVLILIAVNITALSFSSRQRFASFGIDQVAISLISPLQQAISAIIRRTGDVWSHYFSLVSAAIENDQIKKDLDRVKEQSNRCIETEMANRRLRKLLKFRAKMVGTVVSTEVIGKDPSPWFKTIIIAKGTAEGVKRGLPVVIPEGIAGQVTDVSTHHAKVTLIIDPNSAVDAIVQRTRSRGIVKGGGSKRCRFSYALRKHDIKIGDVIISSGMDGVFPKGLRIGRVSKVLKRNSGIFQDVKVEPFVDFETLEEVLVIPTPGLSTAVDEQ